MDAEEVIARNSRAEARKRKILQNSENRLLKLSGKSVTKIHACETDQESETERIQQEDLLATHTLESHDSIAYAEQTINQQVSQESPVRNRLHDNSTVHDGTVRLNKSTVSSRESTTEQESCLPESDQAAATKTADEGLTQRIARVRLLGCTVAAILAKILLNIGIGVLFLKSLVIVFILLQIALFRYQTSQLQGAILPHKSSILSSALVLCGIPPHLVSVHSQIMSVIEEFTIFSFTFIIVHVIL